ncbi:ABC transporter ATP-binding protein [Actinotalea fermentans]|uniref:ABC-type quaternary amine transporter n=1 Tax=Actinotalea fermentans TaxID=43671 RepID=A0A511Z185_9CELL|nr:ABC transporter ATP-binding protein [Actinotalea fermentans]KGM17440.1 hypothetical protein N867_03610 [Actinotalea fermentans ATCC 43279 = JCM 9966 = DSM 3133]GEN81220.1 ABC transporter [Actinotalea fermentans]
MSRLEVRGLHKSFGATPVLRGMDLDVPSGALAALLGHSGCGKTTLMRIVAGFEQADAGEVLIDGRTVVDGPAGAPPERRRVSVVPQEGALFPHLTVAQNVGFGLPGRGPAARRHRRERVRDLLALIGLPDVGERMPSQLSGGQQQRVAVARALAPEPDVVLLDEPFSALDAALRSALREDVRAALKATGATGVLVTHDQEEALSIADLVAVVRDGVVVQAAEPARVYREPVDLDTARFVGDAVLLPAEVTDGVARTPVGTLKLLRGDHAGGRGLVAVRPEQFHMVGAGRGAAIATVDAVTFHGHDATVRLVIAGTDGPGAPGTAGQAVLCRTQGPLPDVGTQVSLLVAGPVSFFTTEAPTQHR